MREDRLILECPPEEKLDAKPISELDKRIISDVLGRFHGSEELEVLLKFVLYDFIETKTRQMH